jgi:hypothetical protein
MFAGRLAPEIMVETHDAVDFRPGQAQCTGHYRHGFGGNETKGFLDRMQNRHQWANFSKMPFNGLLDHFPE